MYIIIKAIGTNEHRMTKTARKKKNNQQEKMKKKNMLTTKMKAEEKFDTS